MDVRQCNNIIDLFLNISICEGSRIILNAQSALFWHEYMPRDVCATHALYN